MGTANETLAPQRDPPCDTAKELKRKEKKVKSEELGARRLKGQKAGRLGSKNSYSLLVINYWKNNEEIDGNFLK